jgi:hypothetical protein
MAMREQREEVTRYIKTIARASTVEDETRPKLNRRRRMYSERKCEITMRLVLFEALLRNELVVDAVDETSQ